MIRGWPWTMLVAICGVAVCAGDEPGVADSGFRKFVQSHCTQCHDKSDPKASLDLDKLLAKDIAGNAEAWEKVVRKLTARQMPPKDIAKPSEAEYDEAIATLEASLDTEAAKSPNPGRTETFRRLTRTEYRNSIRDLLDLEVDINALLPADELSHGFDNVTVADLSPSLLNRYISAAQKISRLVVGASHASGGETVRIRPDLTQDAHIEGLPVGTRGGAVVAYNFPVDGEYEIQVHLMRDRNEGIEGLSEPHELEILLDRERKELVTIKPPPRGASDRLVDANLKTRFKVNAGSHKLGVTFLKKPSSLLETTRQPLHVHFNFYRHPRIGPAVYEISILGPFDATGPGDSPSRRSIFTSRPTGAADGEKCAKDIFSNLARKAYRRAIEDDDLRVLMEAYRTGAAEGGFEAGVESGLCALLVNPQFLFRIERDTPNASSGAVSRIGDLELASRLSYFLWSSLPDEELLARAERGELSKEEVLETQVLRMLADERSQSLVENFAGQWLYLRNLESISPNMRLYGDFDDNLRQAMRRETELTFAELVRDDASVLDLLKSDHTYLNERLAQHYGIPNVYGTRFRKVPLDTASHRGGLLRQASLLTVTSYATRTSPVLRGHWVLQNLVGMAPPPPPPDVPSLQDNHVAASLPIRERLAAHRTNAACASCHQQMDPVGFALEHFDAIGRWRKTDAGHAIDSAAGFIDGSEFDGVDGLEQALLNRPELFVRTFTEKLFTYSLGRGVEYYDAPAVRKIVRDARGEKYRFSKLILGIVNSAPFQMRKSP